MAAYCTGQICCCDRSVVSIHVFRVHVNRVDECFERSVVSINVFRVHVNRVDECFEMIRIHVGIHAMAQVGNVALSAKLLQHVLHVSPNVILIIQRRQKFKLF